MPFFLILLFIVSVWILFSPMIVLWWLGRRDRKWLRRTPLLFSIYAAMVVAVFSAVFGIYIEGELTTTLSLAAPALLMALTVLYLRYGNREVDLPSRSWNGKFNLFDDNHTDKR